MRGDATESEDELSNNAENVENPPTTSKDAKIR
jgi:hypothetical protein